MGISSYPLTPRLVNRFSLGSDPEFTFTDAKKRYIHAEGLGLTTMHGFGCDMAGRQAEIRAYPSRFALEVVASIVDSLRWMAYAHASEVLPLKWTATAFNGKDGCGGHIHFGRRRPGRSKEVEVLDTMTMTLLDMGVLDKVSFRARQRDNPNQHYGQYGDIRLQSHGFEYRTLPTELSSPWLTYFVMVVSKLLLYHGRLWRPSVDLVFEEAIGLLLHYQDVDDDAAIALMAIRQHGFPKESAEDFKPHWGIPALDMCYSNYCSAFFPSSIKAEDKTCLELFEYLIYGTPLPNRVPAPTWEPFKLPKGFYKVDVQRHTMGHLPDVGMDLVSKGVKIDLLLGECLTISHGVPLPVRAIKEALRPAEVRFYLHQEKSISISVSQGFNKSLEQCKLLHKVLGNTELFPVCKAKDLSRIDWTKWDNNAPTVKPMLGKLVAQVVGKPKEIPKELMYSVNLEDIPVRKGRRAQEEEDL